MKKKAINLTFAALAMVATMTAVDRGTDRHAISVDIYENFEINPFCKAIVEGDLETVRRMIELGEDVNQKSLGMTPAIFAARYNKADILRLLIANGANLRKKCDKGWSVAKYAKLSNAKDVLVVLQEQNG